MSVYGSALSLRGLSQRTEAKHDNIHPTIVEGGESSKERNYLTFSLYASFLALGMACGLTGPTFVHLSYLFGTDIKTLSFTHIFGSFGYVVGSLLCGAMSERFNYQLQLSVSTLCLGTAMVFCPWMPTFYFYYGADFVKNVCMAYLDTISQSYIISLWNSHRFKEPVMQGMHSVWSVGATICPFVIIPFLSKLPQESYQTDGYTTVTVTTDSFDAVTNFTSTNKDEWEDYDFTSVRYCFGLVGGIVMSMSSFGFVGYFIYSRRNISKHTAKEIESIDNKESKVFRRIMLTFQFVFFFTAVWFCFIPGGYMSTFVIQGFNWEAKYGSMLTSVFWVCHGLGRILAIPISYCISPGKMVSFDLTLASFAFILMLLIPLTSEHLIWLSTAIAGISIATLIPSMFLWTSSYIQMSGSAGAVALITGASFGVMICGPLIGYLIQEYTHMWLVYLCLISSLSAIVLYCIMYITVKCFHKQGRRRNDQLTPESQPMAPQKNVQ